MILIAIDFESPTGEELVHRIRNYGEALFDEFRNLQSAQLPLEEVDRAVSRLTVRIGEADEVDTVLKTVREQLRIHNLLDQATISKTA